MLQMSPCPFGFGKKGTCKRALFYLRGVQSMRILLYGHKGWIGHKIAALIAASPHALVRGTARIDDVEALDRELAATQPERVICCVGRTHGPGCSTIDYLEQPGRLVDNVRDNLFAPLALALRCRDAGIHLTYLGTGCIFEYAEEKRVFREDSAPNFFGSGYSVVKGFTDQLMHLLEGTVLNLRIRMPITDEVHPRNFITKIASYDKICSVPNSMSVLDELLPCLVDLCERGETGTVNLCNPGVMSHNEILALYREIVDPAFTWENFSQEEQDALLAAGRSNNELDASQLQRLCPGILPLREAVTRALHRMKKRRYKEVD